MFSVSEWLVLLGIPASMHISLTKLPSFFFNPHMTVFIPWCVRGLAWVYSKAHLL